jgi:F0F1-type ATP synthase delta subunit
MKSQYAQALLGVLNDGMPVDTALLGLRAVLKKKQHEKLLPSILAEVLRVLDAKKGATHAVVAVASEADLASLKSAINAALQELGTTATTEVQTTVDGTLIGGFVARFNFKEQDRSYKKSLKNLYESIIK